jgi:hypothetical protein
LNAPDRAERIPRVEQAKLGTLSGLLRSEQGTALGGSRVLVWSTSAQGTSFEVPSKKDGWFVVRDIPQGTYSLRALFVGYEMLSRAGIVVGPGENVVLELNLRAAVDRSGNRSPIPRTADEGATQLAEASPQPRLIRRSDAEAAQQREQTPVGEDSQVFTPVANRWKLRYPEFRRYAGPGDFQFVRGHWYDPFNTNRLKGDLPILGNRIFTVLSAASETFNEERQIPLAPKPSGAVSTFSRTQYAMAQNFTFSAELFGGDAAFRPVDWRIRITPVINVNYTSVGSPTILNFTNPGFTRLANQVGGLQEVFAEAKLKDLSSAYDTVSVRAGIQSFTSDFRGFIFADREPGIRFFGNLGGNRYQYNLAGFATLNKDPNSGLNQLSYRRQQVFIANLYRQDFPWRGYTAELSFHFDKDDPSAATNVNHFQVRPVPIGANVLHAVRAYYLGFAGDGHIGRLNVSHAFYQALGHDTYNALAMRPVKINARMGALELSLDRNWVRYRTSFFYASGSRDPRSGTAQGFDAILDNPNFAGGAFSYWNREQINITPTGIGLVSAGSLLPDIRPGRASGQANFVNPGLLLYNAGVDLDLTPKLRTFANLNLVRFVHTQPLEVLLNRQNIHAGIGADNGVGLRYRPLLNDNVVITVGFNTLVPFAGFRQIYPGSSLYAVFTSIRFQY